MILARIAREKQSHERMIAAYGALGGLDWYNVQRNTGFWQGQGMADLLKLWDFASQIDKARQAYEEV
ncbi:MAG: hypothetical protein R3E79_61090 [Caldilineaceae bacterium]